jgi:hypothetical protein
VQDGELPTAMSELCKLLECFTNGWSMNIIFDPAKMLINDRNDNKELKW